MESRTKVFRRVLLTESERFGIALTGEQLHALCAHYALIAKWNPRVRLVGTTAPARAARELFADSLIAAQFAERIATAARTETRPRMLDIGAGAGLPGMVIKIVHPEWPLLIIESHAKKISFLRMLIHELGARTVEIARGRAETLAHDERLRERFDLVFCRAVASPVRACELAVPFVAIGGSFIAQAGHIAARERARLERVADTLGAKLGNTMTYILKDSRAERTLAAVDKTIRTPKAYPRTLRKIHGKPLPCENVPRETKNPVDFSGNTF